MQIFYANFFANFLCKFFMQIFYANFCMQIFVCKFLYANFLCKFFAVNYFRLGGGEGIIIEHKTDVMLIKFLLTNVNFLQVLILRFA